MTEQAPLIRHFPVPTTPALSRAYYNLYVAENGSDQQKRALGNVANLPRPWEPGSITDPQLRYETWMWLDDVVAWFNHEYVWNLSAGFIPPCWPQHPHLVHEIAVLADQRWQDQTAFRSDRLEEWHRYAIPTFIDRQRQRIHDGCDPNHADWPAQSKHARYTAGASARRALFVEDCEYVDTQDFTQAGIGEPPTAALDVTPARDDDPGVNDGDSLRPRLRIVSDDINPETGEIS